MVRRRQGHETDTLVPQAGFIRHFVDYASKCTDAPEIYHVLSAITAASVALSDRVHLTMDKSEDSRLPLNVWHMVIGRSSLDRKSTSVNLASDLISSAIPDRIAPDSGSMEGLLEYLSENPTCIFVVPELRTLLDQIEASYWKHGKTLLMDLYDARETYSRKLRGQEPVVVNNPRISLLGASALAMLDANNSRVDWTGGFFARCLMIYAERTRFQNIKKRIGDNREDLVTELLDLSLIDRSKVIATSRARLLWSRFSFDMDKKARNAPTHLHGPMCRLADHVLKIAGIYAATTDTELGYTHMNQAIQLGRICMKSIESIGDKVARDPQTRIRSQVLDVIKNANGRKVTQRDVLRSIRIPVAQLRQVLDTLVAEEAISIERRGKKAFLYLVDD